MNKKIGEVTGTPEQKAELKEKAAAMSMPVSQYLLFCALNARIDVKIGLDSEPVYLSELYSMYKENLITNEEFKRLKTKIKNNCGRRAIEEAKDGGSK